MFGIENTSYPNILLYFSPGTIFAMIWYRFCLTFKWVSKSLNKNIIPILMVTKLSNNIPNIVADITRTRPVHICGTCQLLDLNWNKSFFNKSFLLSFWFYFGKMFLESFLNSNKNNFWENDFPFAWLFFFISQNFFWKANIYLKRFSIQIVKGILNPASTSAVPKWD